MVQCFGAWGSGISGLMLRVGDIVTLNTKPHTGPPVLGFRFHGLGFRPSM